MGAAMNGQRFYSLLQVKELDDDRREISGFATTPSPDRVGDIVDPMGAKFSESIPLLWQHRHDSPIGKAFLGKPTKSGIKYRANVAKVDEDGPLKLMLDMAWQSIKAGLVPGVSIGFRPLKYDYMSEGGIRFTEYEIYELSAVTIPANASATIQTIKAMDSRGAYAGGPVRLITRAVPLVPHDPNAGIRLVPASSAVRLNR